MTVPFKEKLAKFTPAQQRQVEARADQLMEALSIRDLRKARRLTQKDLAVRLKVNQANISKLETRTDLMLSTLSGYLSAMGGKLELVARFKGRKPVRLTGLASLAPASEAPKKAQSGRARGTTAQDTRDKPRKSRTAEAR